jgi:hypothetical protein
MKLGENFKKSNFCCHIAKCSRGCFVLPNSRLQLRILLLVCGKTQGKEKKNEELTGPLVPGQGGGEAQQETEHHHHQLHSSFS